MVQNHERINQTINFLYATHGRAFICQQVIKGALEKIGRHFGVMVEQVQLLTPTNAGGRESEVQSLKTSVMNKSSLEIFAH